MKRRIIAASVCALLSFSLGTSHPNGTPTVGVAYGSVFSASKPAKTINKTDGDDLESNAVWWLVLGGIAVAGYGSWAACNLARNAIGVGLCQRF